METRKMPAHVIRFGKVQASVWRNETKHGVRFNVTAARLYQENGEWKRSDSFGRDELLTAARALEAAHDWIRGNGTERDEGLEETNMEARHNG